jgi:hypothetical protein
VEGKLRERCDSSSDRLQKFVIRLWFSKAIPLDVAISTRFLLTLMQIYTPQASACIFLLGVHNSDSHKIAQNLSLLENIFSFSQLHPVICCSCFKTLSVSLAVRNRILWISVNDEYEKCRKELVVPKFIVPEFTKRNRDKQDTWDCILLPAVK